MKYYEVVSNNFCFYLKGKIYPENYKQSEYCNNIVLHAKHCPSDFKKVPAGEYFAQEGKMPEYFAIKKVADNPLRQKYIDWLNNTYSEDLLGCIDEYYGFDSEVLIRAKLKYFKNNPVELTLEQWDKIINKTMEEEFKLPAKWCTKIDNQEVVDYCNIHGLFPPYKIIKNENTYAHFPSWRDCTTCNRVKPGYTEITKEQFIKYVLNQEVMEKEEKEIIGWKLKEDCNQYRKAIEKLVHPMCLSNEIENLGVERNYLSIAYLRQAGVLDLWFTPVYKEKTLQFGGYDVIFEKVASGVRITCNGETGTFSQIEAIYNIVLKKEKMIFGSQEVKQISYSDDTYWSSESLKAKPVSIKIGCTEGTWEEFTAIYEKAKSML